MESSVWTVFAKKHLDYSHLGKIRARPVALSTTHPSWGLGGYFSALEGLGRYKAEKK